MTIKNIDFYFKKNHKLYSIYSGCTSVYYFFRFMYFVVKEKSIRLLRYYPGHYSSAIPSKEFLIKNRNSIFNQDIKLIEGVDINEDYQLKLMKSFIELSTDFVFPEKKQATKRYYYDNPMFGYNDAYILCCFLKKYKPNNIIEVGSGYSSALLLDSIELIDKPNLNLTFIEPYPDRLYSLLGEDDRKGITIIEKNIQNVPIKSFKSLESNDILFVDTSHVLKIDSDLSKILFSILPALNQGVLIHFHDIFWPFEYPKVIIDDGRLWNESYFLRSFLQYNDIFEILFFSSYMESFYKKELVEKIPGFENSTGSSLWLRKKVGC
jgi:predicted O-methyltransferase YrrM